MNRVIAIAAGMAAPKKGDEPFRRAHRYLNYGLLGLVSRLGEDIPVIHGNFSQVERFLSVHPSILHANVILLSIPSFFAMSWAKELIFAVLRRRPGIAIHVGGRWVIDYNWDFVRSQLPKQVFIHRGLGEPVIDQLGTEWDARGTYGDRHRTQETILDYTLLHDREEFHPSVEVSRGCGLGCAFCEEANSPLRPLKSPEILLKEISGISNIYRQNKNFYFESSMFAPSMKWVTNFMSLYTAGRHQFKWRTETRADVMTSEKLSMLAKAGLRVIDIGLESGSPQQLQNMGKTADPVLYLERATKLFEACAEAEVLVKVNILLYPGENIATLRETTQYLRERKHLIGGVSTYPVIVYGTGDRLRYFQDLYKAQGAGRLISTGTPGVWDIDLSSEMSAEDGKVASLELAQEFMTMEQYFVLKEFSYFTPNYEWSEFVEDIASIPKEKLPFGV